MKPVKLPRPNDCRNPHDGESPLTTILRLVKKKNKKPKPNDWKDKVIY